MNSKLLLFDIDKTLVKSMHREFDPWKIAFEKVYGVEDSVGLAGVDTHGKTHRGLVREGLRSYSLAEEVIVSKVDEFLHELGEIYSTIIAEGEVVFFPRIHELLETLTQKGFCLGLITGNTKRIAFDKLRKGGVDKFFEIGGFGEDGETRDVLVELAVERAKEKFNTNFTTEDILVFGDAPLDINAAKVHSLRTVGVATGEYSRKELEAVGADFVLDNLEDIDEVLRIASR